MIGAYVFTFERPDHSWGAVTDDRGRLVGTQLHEAAVAFADRIEQRGFPLVQLTIQPPGNIAELIMSAGTPASEIGSRFVLIEAEGKDVLRHARELADRVPLTRVHQPVTREAQGSAT